MTFTYVLKYSFTIFLNITLLILFISGLICFSAGAILDLRFLFGWIGAVLSYGMLVQFMIFKFFINRPSFRVNEKILHNYDNKIQRWASETIGFFSTRIRVPAGDIHCSIHTEYSTGANLLIPSENIPNEWEFFMQPNWPEDRKFEIFHQCTFVALFWVGILSLLVWDWISSLIFFYGSLVGCIFIKLFLLLTFSNY